VEVLTSFVLRAAERVEPWSKGPEGVQVVAEEEAERSEATEDEEEDVSMTMPKAEEVVQARLVRKLLVQALSVEGVVQPHQGRRPDPGSDRGEKHGRHAVMGVLAPVAWEMAMKEIWMAPRRET
jgi:hypothetical protein